MKTVLKRLELAVKVFNATHRKSLKNIDSVAVEKRVKSGE